MGLSRHSSIPAGCFTHWVTGISDPYGAPTSAEIVVHTGDQSIEESAQAVLDDLAKKGLIAAASAAK